MAKTKPNKSEDVHEEETLDMYLSLLGNLSLWSVIPNVSSFGKNGRVEAGRCIARTSLYKYVSFLSSMYIFIVADLVAQMVFGEILEAPNPIDKLPIEERVKIFR